MAAANILKRFGKFGKSVIKKILLIWCVIIVVLILKSIDSNRIANVLGSKHLVKYWNKKLFKNDSLLGLENAAYIRNTVVPFKYDRNDLRSYMGNGTTMNQSRTTSDAELNIENDNSSSDVKSSMHIRRKIHEINLKVDPKQEIQDQHNLIVNHHNKTKMGHKSVNGSDNRETQSEVENDQVQKEEKNTRKRHQDNKDVPNNAKKSEMKVEMLIETVEDKRIDSGGKGKKEESKIVETKPETVHETPSPEVPIFMKYYPDGSETDYPLSVLPDPYIIRNQDACADLPELKIIVVITSAASNFIQRQNVRNTWGKLSNYKQNTVKIVFILARVNNDMLQRVITKESEKFKDIVQGSFVDSYINLTHKSVLGVRWVNKHCMNAALTVKVDDDVVVNLFEVLKIVDRGEVCPSKVVEMAGHLRPTHTSRIFRNEGNKWRVDPRYFPGETHYPFPYIDGLFTLISMRALPILYQTAKRMPYFWIEDVYLSGLLPAQSKQIKITDLPGVMPLVDDGVDCLNIYKDRCNLTAALASTTVKLRLMWSTLLKYYT